MFVRKQFQIPQIVSGPKPKFPGGACPQIPLVCNTLCKWIRTCPPNNPYNLILPFLGAKAESHPELYASLDFSSHPQLDRRSQPHLDAHTPS